MARHELAVIEMDEADDWTSLFEADAGASPIELWPGIAARPVAWVGLSSARSACCVEGGMADDRFWNDGPHWSQYFQ